MHSLLQHLIADAASGASMEDPEYVAHALLAALHVDLVEEMIAGGLSIEEIRGAQAAHVRLAISNGTGGPNLNHIAQDLGAHLRDSFIVDKVGSSRNARSALPLSFPWRVADV
jgi:hypothetical protein